MSGDDRLEAIGIFRREVGLEDVKQAVDDLEMAVDAADERIRAFAGGFLLLRLVEIALFALILWRVW